MTINIESKATETTPDWATETPEDPIEYQLTMWDAGTDAQTVYMTRDEYIALKQHLAKLRGHVEEAEEKDAIRKELPRETVQYSGYLLRVPYKIPEDSYLDMDKDGDEIQSCLMAHNDDCFGDITVFIIPNLNPKGVARLLRKIADIAETNNHTYTERTVYHTTHPARQHIDDLQQLHENLIKEHRIQSESSQEVA